MKHTLHIAANGHLTMDFNDLPDSAWESLSLRLESVDGFRRVGNEVLGGGEKILHSFEGADFTLAAGWDNWSGYYLLSESAAADVFLRHLSSEMGT